MAKKNNPDSPTGTSIPTIKADMTNAPSNDVDNTQLPTTEEVNGKLRVTASLVPNIRVARSLYNRFRYSHLDRILLYASIQGLVAGNPPYDMADLERDKLAHIANFNNLDARSLIDRATLAFWNLLNEPQCLYKFEFVDVEFKAPASTQGASEEAIAKKNVDPATFAKDPASLDIAEILARNLDIVVRSWPSFERNNNVLALQLNMFGLSPVVWPNEKDWRWDVVPLERFFVADQASTDIEKLTTVFVETDFTLQYLFQVYEAIKEADQDDIPWDKESLKQLLLIYGKQMMGAKAQNTAMDNPMDYQRMLQDGDIGIDTVYSDTIRLVSGLVVEYDGSITHIIFDKTDNTTNILFRQPGQYKHLQEGLVIFSASPGAQTLHENIGVGHKLYAACQATMQLDCSLIDGAKMASTVFINTPTGNVGASADQIRIYPSVPTNIGTAQLQQNNLGANLQPLIGVASYITQKLQYNIASSGEDQSLPDVGQGSKSAPEAKMSRLARYAPQKNSIAQYYKSQDLVARNMVAKLLASKKGDPGYEYAKRWKDMCIAEGVDKTLFELRNVDQWGMPAHLRVKAARVAGDGSQEALLLKLESLQAIAGDFGPREAREYKKQYILATAGKDFIPAFLQDSDSADERSGGASLAHLENSAMQNGQAALMSPDNDQRGHIAQHMALGENVISQVQQQQMDVVQADEIMGMLIPHLEEHINFFAQSPFGITFIKGIMPGWNQLKTWADLNRKNAARAYQAQIKERQEAEQNQQKVMSEEELKQFQVQQDEQRKNIKAQNADRRAMDSHKTKKAVLIDKTKAEIAAMQQKTSEAGENERRKTTLKNNLETQQVATKESLETMGMDELRQGLTNINGATPAPYDIE